VCSVGGCGWVCQCVVDVGGWVCQCVCGCGWVCLCRWQWVGSCVVACGRGREDVLHVDCVSSVQLMLTDLFYCPCSPVQLCCMLVSSVPSKCL